MTRAILAAALAWTLQACPVFPQDTEPDATPVATEDMQGPVDMPRDVTSDTSKDLESDVTPDASRDAPLDLDPGTYPIRDCSVEVVFDGAANTSVTAAGQFNDWDVTATPLTRSDGAWRARLTPPPGEYAYKFVLDGEYETTVPIDVYTHFDGVVENRNLRVPDCRVPALEVGTVSVSEQGLVRGEVQFVRGIGLDALDPETLEVTVGDQSVTPTVDAVSGVLTFEHQAQAFGKYTVRVRARDVAGQEVEELYMPLWHEAEPFVWQDAVIYLIFTDRFLDTDGVDRRIPGAAERANYQGGDFQGITQKIREGYFQDLGVNTLWLSPIYDNTNNAYPDKNNDPTKMMTGFHGYWPISYDPEPRYGNGDQQDARAALQELVTQAHARGMRVMFDIALNHVHQDHGYCQEDASWCNANCLCGTGQGCGWDPGNGGLYCLFDTFLPDLDYRNHDILRRVVADTRALLQEYDVDGLRIDAARHMDHIIMRTLRKTLRDEIEVKGGAPYYLVGETFTDDRGQIMEYVGDHELHGQFDFAMRTAIRRTFGPEDASFQVLDQAALDSEADTGYGAAVEWMSPFFGNHDIDRFATVLSRNDQGPWGDTVDLMAAGPKDTIDQWDIINRMTLSYAFLLAYKGIPLLYYGDEVGLAGSRDPDNRRMMPWDWSANQRELHSRAATIGKARRDIKALRRGDRRELWKDDTLYAFIRGVESGEAAIVVMAKSASRSETITIPASYGLEGATLTSYNSARTLTISGGEATLTLDPWEYAIFHVE